MKISELIALLKEKQDKHGNIEVFKYAFALSDHCRFPPIIVLMTRESVRKKYGRDVFGESCEDHLLIL